MTFLLDTGADPNLGRSRGYPALHLASQRPELVRVLLEHGADPFLPDDSGRKLLNLARLPEESRRVIEAHIAGRDGGE